jgi:5-methyltetrahydrofolate--homocysteine methyltransferase
MAIDVNFTQEDWERSDEDWAAWWRWELDRPLVMIWGEKAGAGPQPPDFVSSYPLDVPADEVLDAYTGAIESALWLGDAWPKWWTNFGAGIMAGFLGARVIPRPDTVWFEPAERLPIHELSLTYDANNVWWQRVRGLTEGAIERWGDRVTVGHTDLGGNLDILASLLSTEGLLYALIDAPEEVDRLAREITALWLRYYDELHEIIRRGGRGTTPWAAIRTRGRCYMLQSDFSYMISPAMFERFVMPDLRACCAALDHAFYHLDGKGQLAHLDFLLGLEELDGIQWVPGDGAPPPEAWLDLLRRVRDAGKLQQLYVSARGALEIVRQVGGEGFAFGITEAMTAEEARAFLEELRRAT